MGGGVSDVVYFFSDVLLSIHGRIYGRWGIIFRYHVSLLRMKRNAGLRQSCLFGSCFSIGEIVILKGDMQTVKVDVPCLCVGVEFGFLSRNP